MGIREKLQQSQAELFERSGARSVMSLPNEGPEIAALRQSVDPGFEDGKLRLHVGGRVAREGWKILDVRKRPEVDFVGDCCDLSRFSAGSVWVIYASHVLEHLRYRDELSTALSEFRRVLVPDGQLLVSVPDFRGLCRAFLEPSLDIGARCSIMRAIFGAQDDEHDEHKAGLWDELLVALLHEAGFHDVRKVPLFGIFADASTLMLGNRFFSLNFVAK